MRLSMYIKIINEEWGGPDVHNAPPFASLFPPYLRQTWFCLNAVIAGIK
jgi:hypothetical protein